jgi:hypothetical protein
MVLRLYPWSRQNYVEYNENNDFYGTITGYSEDRIQIIWDNMEGIYEYPDTFIGDFISIVDLIPVERIILFPETYYARYLRVLNTT